MGNLLFLLLLVNLFGFAYADWQEWGEWGVCCEEQNGFKIRRRTCESECVGSNIELLACDCPIPEAEWSAWSEWGECCEREDGVKVRRRACSEPGSCSGPEYELLPCQCSVTTTQAPVEWSAWGEWGECCEEEDGVKVRKRTCNVPGLCSSPDRDLVPCQCPVTTTQAPVGWSEWGEWGECCEDEQGVKVRKRTCNGEPDSCSGPDRDIKVCESPVTPPQAPEERTAWSAWSDCGADPKSPGLEIRIRECPSDREKCVGSYMEERPCRQGGKFIKNNGVVNKKGAP